MGKQPGFPPAVTRPSLHLSPFPVCHSSAPTLLIAPVLLGGWLWRDRAAHRGNDLIWLQCMDLSWRLHAVFDLMKSKIHYSEVELRQHWGIFSLLLRNNLYIPHWSHSMAYSKTEFHPWFLIFHVNFSSKAGTFVFFFFFSYCRTSGLIKMLTLICEYPSFISACTQQLSLISSLTICWLCLPPDFAS